MGAVRAVQFKTNAKTLDVPVSKRNRKVKAKVIKLPVHRVKSKVRVLTEAQREDLILTHRIQARKLGRSILRNWHSRLDLQEVDSIVDLSLCEAVRNFNINKGASFLTFLYYHLRGNLIRAVDEAANCNLVPCEFRDAPVGPEERAYSAPIMSASEVAEALNGSEEFLPDACLYKKELANLSHNACQGLDTLEKEVVFRLYLGDEQLMDIANSLGYSRCHISRVKKKALKTLNRELDCIREESTPKTRKTKARPKLRRLITRRGRVHQAILAKRGNTGTDSQYQYSKAVGQ